MAKQTLPILKFCTGGALDLKVRGKSFKDWLLDAVVSPSKHSWMKRDSGPDLNDIHRTTQLASSCKSALVMSGRRQSNEYQSHLAGIILAKEETAFSLASK
jgi:hypothetical protein